MQKLQADIKKHGQQDLVLDAARRVRDGDRPLLVGPLAYAGYASVT
jgi:hypothetical protein